MVETAAMVWAAKQLERRDFEYTFWKENGRWPTVEELGEHAKVYYD